MTSAALIKEYKLEAQLTPGGKPDINNGIIYEGDRFYVTGKYYPYVFEIAANKEATTNVTDLKASLRQAT